MTVIVRINKKNWKAAAEFVAKQVGKGKIAVIPTETSYGLVGLATDKQAIAKVCKAKKQGFGKAISILVSSIEVAREYCYITKATKMLVGEFMPGPLNIVVEKKGSLPGLLSRRSVAFRISSNRFTREVCELLGKPITATSANISGQKAIYSAEETKRVFDGKVDIIVDAGNLKRERPSTIFDTLQNKILRKGRISEKQIRKAMVGK